MTDFRSKMENFSTPIFQMKSIFETAKSRIYTVEAIMKHKGQSSKTNYTKQK